MFASRFSARAVADKGQIIHAGRKMLTEKEGVEEEDAKEREREALTLGCGGFEMRELKRKAISIFFISLVVVFFRKKKKVFCAFLGGALTKVTSLSKLAGGEIKQLQCATEVAPLRE